MIVTYCYFHPLGLALLDHASKLGCTRSQNTMKYINSGQIDPEFSRCIDGYHTSLGAIKEHAVSQIVPYSKKSEEQVVEDTRPSTTTTTTTTGSTTTSTHARIKAVETETKKMWGFMKKSHWDPHFNVSWERFSAHHHQQDHSQKKNLPNHFEVCLWNLIH